MKKTPLQRVTILGLIINIFLSIMKCSVGVIAGSQALIADGFHSLSDITTDLALLFGERFWTAPADHSHPYGHRRIETLITLFIGLCLVGAAIGIGMDAIITLRSADRGHPGWLAFIVAVASIISKEWLYRYTLRVGKRIHSAALQANAWHHRSDAFSSMPVAIAVLTAIVYPKWYFIDSLGALLVCCFLLYSSWEIIKPALAELAESGACQRTQEQIHSIILKNKGVLGMHAIRSRRIGGCFYIDLHLLVDGSLSVREGHAIGGQVKHALLNADLNILDVLIHIEPNDPEQQNNHTG